VPEFRIKKNDKIYKITADTQQEAIDRVLAHVSKMPAPPPRLTGTEKAAAFAGEFAEGAFGIGDELGAIGRGIGGSVYDIFNTDKDIMQALRENFNWSEDIAATRAQMRQFEEENPLLSNVAYGSGFVSGLGVPIGAVGKGASATKAAAVGAGYGAGFGALSGEGEEGRIQGALTGAAVGGAVGGAAQKIGQKLNDIINNPNASVTDEVEAITDRTPWTNVGEEIRFIDKAFVGVSDAIRRRISPQIGGRVQRADESAVRQKALENAEFVENTDMQNVINLWNKDDEFAGMVLDYAQGQKPLGEMLSYVNKELGGEATQALVKYLDWSKKSNALFNERLGRNQDATDYLHTQREGRITKRRMLSRKERTADYIEDFADDEINMPIDRAQLKRTRELAEEGLRVRDYANPFLTNAQRIHNNNRLLQLQEKFGIKKLNKGADGLMNALERKFKERGIDEYGARDARNAIAMLIKGQNTSANAWIKSFQNSGYTVLAGPKTALLNFHDIPFAAWNNGISSVRGLVNSEIRKSADVERLGLGGQNVGEFFQNIPAASKKRSAGEIAESITKSITDKAMKYGGFQTADRIAKNQVLKTVAQDAVDRANAGTLRQRWGRDFDPSQVDKIEKALKRTGGNIDNMTASEAKLYDELITLGLGQQQLISAAGRPLFWLNNPNLRPLWMMRGFAIKHNILLAEKIADKLKAGDKAGAAKEATMYLALPGMSYAGMNVGRNELFKEDYEPSAEEFMFSLLDSVLGPITLNSIGVGSSYERSELIKDPAKALLSSVLPPTGLYGDVTEGIVQAIARQDADELGNIVADHPLYKQWAAFFD
jgi:hypothetical protein